MKFYIKVIISSFIFFGCSSQSNIVVTQEEIAPNYSGANIIYKPKSN